MFFLAKSDPYNPRIVGPFTGCDVEVLLRDGSLKSVRSLGYLWCNHAKYVAGGRFVKVKAYGLCDVNNIHSCKPLDEGVFLIGYYLERFQGAFILCDDKQVPLQKFCPINLARRPG
jgi:hypothetical protein